MINDILSITVLQYIFAFFLFVVGVLTLRKILMQFSFYRVSAFKTHCREAYHILGVEWPDSHIDVDVQGEKVTFKVTPNEEYRRMMYDAEVPLSSQPVPLKWKKEKKDE